MYLTDTGVIVTNLNRKVSINSINNYEINLISIDTASRVTKAVSREVLIILNQCAYYRKVKIIYSIG